MVNSINSRLDNGVNTEQLSTLPCNERTTKEKSCGGDRLT